MENDKPHILVVDDNLKNLQITAKLLKEEGYLISVAQDGVSALNLLTLHIPDLILLDIMMPEIDGLTVCRIIKQDKRLNDVPIIFLTAKNQTDDVVAGFNAGGVDYIVKPFNHQELIVRVRNHIELTLSRKKILELNQTRDKLYSIIAHDVRSPLNNILSTILLLDEGGVDVNSDEYKEILLFLKESTQNTSVLVNNLLEWTKFQNESVSLILKQNSILTLLNEAIKLYKPAADSKRISIELSVSEEAIAYFDVVTMHTVFRNLISNAIKFTPEYGRIQISSDHEDNALVIRFKDNGVGMSAQTINKIFNKKESYTTLGTKNEKGSGLGLMFIKDFIEKNGGRLDVKSEENNGTCFSVFLPLAS